MKFTIAGCCIALLLLLATSAFAQWQFAYTQDLSYTFYSVNFPTSTVGYIVGTSGVIFKSTDAGSTWTQQTSPTTNTLYKVFFTDATHGFAVGTSGTIIYTTDGTNWSVHAQSGVITTNQLVTVWFVGTNGWIAGGATNSPAEIYKTTDGGTTFSNVTVTNPSTNYCTDISFFDANLGYASVDVNGVMYTTDGGVNWTKSTVNLGPYPYTRTDIECVRAVDDTTAVAGGWGSLVGPQPTILIVSKDGGVTFNSPDESYPWATYNYGFGFAEFDNTDVVFMGGGFMSASITIHSTDDGVTWSRLPAFYWYTVRGCSAVPGTDRIVAVGDQGLITLSTDRGYTWTYPVNPGTFLQGFCYMNGIGAKKVFAVGVGSVYFQIDASTGAIEPGVISPENWGGELEDIKYVVNDRIPPVGPPTPGYDDCVYACGKNAYFCKSVDAGKTWTQLDHAASNYSIYWGMHWFDPDTGVVCGCRDDGSNHRKEYIWRTTDGGTTLNPVWTPQLPGTNNEWNGIAFAPENPAIGVVVGDTKYVAYTTDRGYHWTLGTTDHTTSPNILRVVMINSTTGYAIGTAGTLIKTTDGGQTWQVQAVPWGTKNLWGIAYDTPNQLWVSGADQMCYYSTDGGANWTQINVTQIASTYDVKSIYYQGAAGILWVGTEYGSILNRTDQPVTGTETPKTLPFVLNQNYPNPFNPSTTIEFMLASASHVSLNVYDVTGKLVATVMNKDLKAGKYTVGFTADKLATGVYFYKITTNKGEETRKMVIIR